MKTTLLFLVTVLVAGCASSSIESRRRELAKSYDALSPEQKTMVDSGRIKVGMPMDAVYIAWGKPSQVLTAESSEGLTTTWLYHGTYLEEHRYWGYRSYGYRGGYYASPQLEHDYLPRGYVSAEVRFEKGVVKEWRNLPRPGY